MNILEISLGYWKSYARLNYWIVLENSSIYVSYMWIAWVLKSNGQGFKFQLWPLVLNFLFYKNRTNKPPMDLLGLNVVLLCKILKYHDWYVENIQWIVSGYRSKKSGFAFYMTSYSFPHQISSQPCVINFSFTLAFKWSFTNGRTPEVLFMLKGRYVSKRTAPLNI